MPGAALAVGLCLTPLPTATAQEEIGLPNGRNLADEALKSDHEKLLRDLALIQKLAGELHADLEKKDYRVISLVWLKKAGEMEKLSRGLRSRLKRF